MEVTPEASSDILAAVSLYEGQRLGLSQDFLASLDAVRACLAQPPLSFPLVLGLAVTQARVTP